MSRFFIFANLAYYFNFVTSNDICNNSHVPTVAYENTHPTHPCGTRWLYSFKSGKCYRYFSRCSKEMVTWEEAEKLCRSKSNSDGARFGFTKLVIFTGDLDKTALMDFNQHGNFEGHWLGGRQLDLQSLVVTWLDNSTSLIKASDIKSTSSNDAKRCAAVKIVTELMVRLGLWVTQPHIELRDCNEKLGYFCEYPAKTCDDHWEWKRPFAFDKTSMEIKPAVMKVGQVSKIACKPGYFRWLENIGLAHEPAVQSGALAPHEVNCTGNQQGKFNPDLYSPYFVPEKLKIERCHAKFCDPYNWQITQEHSVKKFWRDIRTISDVVKYPKFPHGYKIELECAHGHVSATNTASSNVTVECVDGPINNKGVWFPDGIPCQAIRCNYTELDKIIRPSYTRIVSAKSAETSKRYTIYTEFNLYKNIVEMECADEQLFFDDRSPKKTVICDVNDTISRIKGMWLPYQGTKIPISAACVDATCKHQDISVRDDDGKIKKFLNFRDDYFIYLSKNRGLQASLSRNLTSDDFDIGTKVVFNCNEGTNSSNGKSTIELECSKGGKWIPPVLTECIKKSEEIALPESTQHYIPPAEEAENAETVGNGVIILLVLFCLFIALLDMATVARDYNLLKRNLRNLKKKYTQLNMKREMAIDKEKV